MLKEKDSYIISKYKDEKLTNASVVLERIDMESSMKQIHLTGTPNDNGPPPINNEADYAETTKKNNPNVHTLLFVHLGEAKRGALSQELWDKVFVAVNLKTELAVIQGQWDSDFRIEWSHWVENRGIVACCNEKTVDIFSNMIKEIVIKG